MLVGEITASVTYDMLVLAWNLMVARARYRPVTSVQILSRTGGTCDVPQSRARSPWNAAQPPASGIPSPDFFARHPLRPIGYVEKGGAPLCLWRLKKTMPPSPRSPQRSSPATTAG